MTELLFLYQRLGWAVFPVHTIRDGVCSCGSDDCARPGKHPAAHLVPHGFHDASNNPTHIETWWSAMPDANIGVATGIKSKNLLVIDLDIKPGKDGAESWRSICEEEIATVEAITGGGGRHLFFTYPDNITIRSGTEVFADAIDVRADGGYIILPPSAHQSGRNYEWELSSHPEDAPIIGAPGWLLDLINRPPVVVAVQDETLSLSPDKVREIRSALTVINSDSRDIWLQIGMALKSTCAGEQAYGLWTEWSQQSEKYDPRDQRRTWTSLKPHGGITLSSLFSHALRAGWVEPDDGPAVQLVAPMLPPSEVLAPDFGNCPGIMADIVEWIYQTSPKPCLEFASTAALSYCATILGRRVMGETELRTNLYLITVGKSGQGKDHPRQCVKKLLVASGEKDLMGGENLASGQSLLTRAKQTSNIVFQIDEFGMMLQAIKGKGAGRHNVEILSNLMKLHSSAGSIYLGTEYADQKQRQREDIEYPCVNLNATTTPEPFYKALTSADIFSGYLNRCLVVDASDKATTPRRIEIDSLPIPPDVISWSRYARKGQIGAEDGNLIGMNPATPYRVPRSSGARAIYSSFVCYVEEMADKCSVDGTSALWQRTAEHADKLATIGACCENISDPVVSAEVMSWATMVAYYYTEMLIEKVRRMVGDTDYEVNRNAVLNEIIRLGERGITKYEIGSNRVLQRFEPRKRRELVDDLAACGLILFGSLDTKGRPRQAYVAAQFVENADEPDALAKELKVDEKA